MEIHSSIDSSEELMHYGRKGMKWYQNIFTKDKGGSGKKEKSDDDDDQKKTESKSSSSSEGVKQTASEKVKRIEEMTNAELQAQIDRMGLEKRYKEAIKDLNPEKTKRGQEFVTKIIEQSAENIGKQFATYVMGTSVNKIFAELFDDPAIVNPKKGQKDK